MNDDCGVNGSCTNAIYCLCNDPGYNGDGIECFGKRLFSTDFLGKNHAPTKITWAYC